MVTGRHNEQIIDVCTQPYDDQKPGTSGLRKRVKVFQEKPNYTENFIQALLEAAGRPKSILLGGDGRYYSTEAIAKIMNVCAANRVERMLVAQHGLLSTPAASILIRMNDTDGGIILTASHNPGGPEGDFGIKYNTSNGGPASDTLTDKIHSISRSLTSYKSHFRRAQVNMTLAGSFQQYGDMDVHIVDSVSSYRDLMTQVFDLGYIREALFRPEERREDDEEPMPIRKKPFKMLADSMNGVVGPYAKKVLVDYLGAPLESLLNAKPLPDFGGKHPDPNLTYAKDLVDLLKKDPEIDFGVAFDGDGDRNMILGQEAFFVTPGDSLAIIAHFVHDLKFFQESHPVNGFARSFPTAPAVDRVARAKKLDMYVTPTGWKYFVPLMDTSRIALCGEESFGTGSVHCREKDGLWAALAWLSIMAQTGMTVKELVHGHWRTYGRDYFCRYDFEECDSEKSQAMMRELESKLESKQLVGQKYPTKNGEYVVEKTGNFAFFDPINETTSHGHGLFVSFQNEARIIFRLSGTGSTGATVRLYVTDYSKVNLYEDSQSYLSDLLKIAFDIIKLPQYTGREEPTVIT